MVLGKKYRMAADIRYNMAFVEWAFPDRKSFALVATLLVSSTA